MKKRKRRSSQYGKIVKENIEAVIPALMEKVLGIKAVHSEELPDDLQHTKERKPDVLKKITDDQGDIFVLQIEFQPADEAEMVYRMAEYFIMLERKYRLPVRQYVIFIGPGIPKMPTELVRERMQFDFPLVAFSELDYQIFLKSDRPEKVVLSILANFRQEEPDEVVERIVQRIRETTSGDLALRRYYQQLRILAQLRNSGGKLNEDTMDSLAQYITPEGDPLYKVVKKRIEEEFIRSFAAKNLTSERIAEIVGVTVEYVEEVKMKGAAEK